MKTAFLLAIIASQSLYANLQIESLYIENVIPSRYKYYTSEPLGRVRIKNLSKQDIERVRVSLFIPEYMNLPQYYEVFKIRGNSTVEVPLLATFNTKIFGVDEDTTAQAQVKVEGGGAEDSFVQSITVLNKNTIDWREGENITSFVTPNDSVIRDFTRLNLPSFRDKDLNILGSKLFDAMAVWVALGSMTYLSDPNMPYTKIANRKVSIDKVQYPRETLRYKKGDCDDLSVLYASCLEAIGVKTAFVFVPGHIFIIFNTGILERNGGLINYDPSSYITREGYIWLPLETTRLGKPFLSAVEEGIKVYRRNIGRLEIIETKRGWQRFAPVALPSTDFVQERVQKEEEMKKEVDRFKSQRKEAVRNRILELKEMVKGSPQNPFLKNQLGIILTREGELNLAEAEFYEILKANKLHSSALNNLGNILLIKGSLNEAISCFEKARESDLKDPAILFNLGIALFLKGNMQSALTMLKESLEGFGSLEEAALTLGFPAEEVAISLTGEPEISREEIARLLKEALEKIPKEEEAKKRAEKIFTLFAGTRGAEISKQDNLSFILYWKE